MRILVEEFGALIWLIGAFLTFYRAVGGVRRWTNRPLSWLTVFVLLFFSLSLWPFLATIMLIYRGVARPADPT